MQHRYGWKERLADSSWVTVGWDWFMTLVGRVVEAVLWVTMAFACYQLIPHVPQPAPAVSAGAFIAQFLALDAGGLGLYKLAEQQALEKWAYARVVSGVLIGITLVTVAYAGIEHAMQVDAHVTTWVEISLVIARSIMTVLYGQAVQSLKQQAAAPAHAQQVLEELANSFDEQLEHLKAQLAQSERRLQQQVTESASGLANELAPLQENLQWCQEVLASVPALQAQLQHIESSTTEELHRMKATLDKQIQNLLEAPEKRPERPILRALPMPSHSTMKNACQVAAQADECQKFDARAFVFACLQENPDAKLADIEKQALAVGQELSQSSISRYRKQFARGGASSFASAVMQVASADASSDSDERRVASK